MKKIFNHIELVMWLTLIVIIIAIKISGLTLHPLTVMFGLLIHVETINGIRDYKKNKKNKEVLDRGLGRKKDAQ